MEEGHLVISRKERETINVGDSIVITVHRIRGDRVTLGIAAPTDVKILRGELSQQPEGGVMQVWFCPTWPLRLLSRAVAVIVLAPLLLLFAPFLIVAEIRKRRERRAWEREMDEWWGLRFEQADWDAGPVKLREKRSVI